MEEGILDRRLREHSLCLDALVLSSRLGRTSGRYCYGRGIYQDMTEDFETPCSYCPPSLSLCSMCDAGIFGLCQGHPVLLRVVDLRWPCGLAIISGMFLRSIGLAALQKLVFASIVSSYSELFGARYYYWRQYCRRWCYCRCYR